MLNSHSTGIQKFILDRLIQIHDEVITPDPEHRQLGNRPDELLQQITAKLADADRLLLDQYDSACAEQLCRQDELIYTEGLMDGIRFGYWVALVGRGIGKIEV